MDTPNNQQDTRLSQLVAQFPRRHLILVSAAILAAFIALLFVPSKSAQATRISQPLALNLRPAKYIEEAPPKAPEQPWHIVKVRKGDNLSTIFHRASLSAGDVYEVVHHSDNPKTLLHLYPGQSLAFQLDDKGQLEALKYKQNLLESTLFEREGDTFTSKHIVRQPELRRTYNRAVITSSLFRAAQSAGMPQDLIMDLANVFGGVIDFVYDVRPGDSFTLLYEKKFIDGKEIGHGPILAAQFVNRGETYTAYRYTHADGSVGYYDEKGVSMRKAFLRAPLDFTRISSGFSLHRMDPLFHVRRPHLGVDYAAPRGTPVYAAGDGRVIASAFSKPNGNYVFIDHGTKYETKYLHLEKRAVHRGERVKQRQIIGWVGATGWATGPHLHYEFLVNGVHRNPRTVKLPKAKSIAAQEKQRFLAQISGLEMQLAAYNNHSNLAKASQLGNSSTL